ncbi:MAG: Asp-tRNA(Asn)/Glu-tRNA(Gln) amidotransferase subunit GatA [Patescibacteria group bacterium]
MSINLKILTISKALAQMEAGTLTSVDLAKAYLAEIEKKNGDINAYREVYTDVLEQAKQADAKRGRGEGGLLLGIPFAIKDNITIAGRIVGASSKILENYVAPYDATVITKLKEAGAIFIGRVNMDEFAMGGSTENSAYGVTKNPHDTERVSGGSSGGSAAAVAMDGALAALGSDTGGSIRQPASFCGLVGLKPTYGSVSRHGLMAMGSSLDVIGPVTKSVEDAEIIFNIISGNDKRDSTTLVDSESVIGDSLDRPLRVGIMPGMLSMGGIHPAVVSNFNVSVELLKKTGCEIKEIDLPHIKYSLAVYYIIMPAEVSSNMARFDGVKYGLKKNGATGIEDYLETRGVLLGREVRRRIMLGTYVLSAGYADQYYNKANYVRDLIRKDFEKAFADVDVVLTPTAPTPAFKIGEKIEDPIQMYLEDIFTVTANLVGLPAMSVPSGFTEIDGKKLPLGIQFSAPHMREDVLFTIGKKFETARDQV